MKKQRSGFFMSVFYAKLSLLYSDFKPFKFVQYDN